MVLVAEDLRRLEGLAANARVYDALGAAVADVPAYLAAIRRFLDTPA